MKKAPQGF